MRFFTTAFESDDMVSDTGEISGAVFDIEKDIEADREIAGADIGDISEDDTQAEIEEILSIESLGEEISNEIAESNRVEEVADNLLDLSTIVERIEHPSETDIALIQTTANMAVAGTDVAAQAILPAMESFTDMGVAAEGIGEKAAAAYNSLRESAAGLAQKVGQFIKKIFSTLSYKEQKLGELKNRVNALPNGAVGSFPMRHTTWFVTDDEEGITDIKDFIGAAKSAVGMYSHYSDAWLGLVTTFQGTVLKSAKRAVGRGGEDMQLGAYGDAWLNGFLGKMSKLKGMQKTDHATKPGVTTYASPAYLGADRIIVNIPSDNSVTASGIDVVNTIKFKQVAKKTAWANRVTFTTTKSELKQLVGMAETQLLNMKKFLDANYKSAQKWNVASIPVTGVAQMSGSYRVISKARNTQFTMTLWTNRYGNGLLRTLLSMVENGVTRAEGGGVTKEDYGFAMEGIGGGIMGVLKQAVPGLARVSDSRDRKKAKELTAEIQRLSKEIAKIKGSVLEEAHDDGKLDDGDYETYSDMSATDVLSELTLKDKLPFLSPIRGYKAASKVQDLSRELKEKLITLKHLTD